MPSPKASPGCLTQDGTLESLAPGHAQSQYNQLLLDIERRLNRVGKGNETVSYTHLTLPTTPYV